MVISSKNVKSKCISKLVSMFEHNSVFSQNVNNTPKQNKNLTTTQNKNILRPYNKKYLTPYLNLAFTISRKRLKYLSHISRLLPMLMEVKLYQLVHY